MKYAEINKRFTEIVNKYLNDGYYFNTSTMSGHQGEIVKADLTNGKDIIRIFIESHYNQEFKIYGDRCTSDTINIVVGRYTDTNCVTPNDIPNNLNTIWNNSLEIIKEEVFYAIGRYSNWYGTADEAYKRHNIAFDRWRNNVESNCVDYTDNDKAKSIVLKYLKKKKGFKSVKLSDITRIYRIYKKSGGVRYEVTARGHFIVIS